MNTPPTEIIFFGLPNCFEQMVKMVETKNKQAVEKTEAKKNEKL